MHRTYRGSPKALPSYPRSPKKRRSRRSIGGNSGSEYIMRSKNLILGCLCLLAISLPATSKMFDIGNYTIDTGAYSLPPNAGLSDDETLEWSWSDGGKTQIMLYTDPVGPEHPEMLNISDVEYESWVVKIMIMQYYSAIENGSFITSYGSSDEFNKKWNSLDAVFVQKPLSGYIVILANHPNIKIYFGVIDRYHYLAIISSESDEMLALIMHELKVYLKEESNTARLQSIKNMINPAIYR